MPKERSTKSANVVPNVVVAMITAQNRKGWNRFAAICALTAITKIVAKIALSYPADSVPPYAPMLQSDGLHISSDAFALILSDPLYTRALLLSLKVAGLSTAICLLAGYPMALAIARSPERWRNLLLMLVMLPFWTGFLMRVNAWIASMRPGVLPVG